MKAEDRERVLRHLQEGMEAVEQAVAALTPEEAAFREDGRWSALELVEHVAITEEYLLKGVKGSENIPDRPMSDPAKDEVMVARVIGRERRVAVPVGLEPTGRYASMREALEAFRAARTMTLEFVETCDRDLRSVHVVHPLLGPIPAYNCLLLLAAHPSRHAAQICEIKRS